MAKVMHVFARLLLFAQRHRVRLAAQAALLMGLGLTALALWQSVDATSSEAEVQFKGSADRMAAEIIRRASQSEVGLRGARALILANGAIDRLHFRRYVAALAIERDFPGIRGFGFVERVPRTELDAFLARTRADNAPDFSVRSTSTDADLLVVKYFEPRNPILGTDIGSDPVRREAAERAIATGALALSEPVVLSGGQIYAWLLFLPVYRDDSMARLPQDRLLGVLYSPLGAPEIFKSLKEFGGGFVNFQLLDRARGVTTVIFDSRFPDAPATGPRVARPESAPLFDDTRPVTIGGRTFFVRITGTHKMESLSRSDAAIPVAIAGTALSILLALAILRLMQRREQAEAQALEASTSLLRVSGGLAQRDRLLHLINDSIPARVSYWDRELRCQLVNRALAESYGRTPEQMVGLRLDEMLPEHRREDSRRRGEAALRGGAQRFESSAFTVDGRKTTATVHFVPDVADGQAQGFFVFAVDITELKEAREAAQRASAAKTQFLSNMSHEIRTPMNAVIGMLALLRTTALNTRQSDYAIKAEAAARSLLSLLNDVLDFSKIEAGKMTLDPRPFSFQSLLDDLREILSASLENKPITLRCTLDPEVPAWLLGDDMRLRQILINLGGNALKFTQRGHVGVDVRLLQCKAQQAELEIAVTDSGIGIPLEDQRRIFDDFGQGAASTTRVFGGTGLGLSICQRLAALMGSHLQVESAPGEGSRFLFRLMLPVVAPPPEGSAASRADADAAAIPTGQPLRGLRLLVAEDNLINQQVAREVLEAAGAEVHLAVNGRDAVLAVAGNGPFDAVLMDIQMPVMDGYAATRDIRQRLGQIDLPIIAMTANAMDNDKEQSRAAGMADHVGKPFVPAALVATILRHARRAPAVLTARPVDETAAASAPVASSVSVLDRAGAIAALQGDEALYARLVPLFRRELEAVLEQLPRVRLDMPRDEATRLLHTLKSSAASLGAHRVSAAATVAEKASREASTGVDERLLATLKDAIEQTLPALG